MTGVWRVLLNGVYLGIKETNYAWASAYWRSRCTHDKRYRLVEDSAP